MLKKMMITLAALMIFAVVPAFADAGCKNGKFVGSYTRVQLNQDIFGDGTVLHTFLTQLTLHSDGTADLYNTALLDYVINTGTASPSIGSWNCRQDGKLVVTFLNANYRPTTTTTTAPKPDIALAAPEPLQSIAW